MHEIFDAFAVLGTASFVASVASQILPPADESRAGIPSKWYAVFHGIIVRLSVLKVPRQPWTDEQRRNKE